MLYISREKKMSTRIYHAETFADITDMVYSKRPYYAVTTIELSKLFIAPGASICMKVPVSCASARIEISSPSLTVERLADDVIDILNNGRNAHFDDAYITITRYSQE